MGFPTRSALLGVRHPRRQCEQPNSIGQPNFACEHAGATVNTDTSAPSTGRSTAIMAVGTLLSRLTGIGRNVAFVTPALVVITDSYQIANNSPNMVYELVVGGVLSATLVPLFVELLGPSASTRDREGASAIVSLSIVAVILLSVALWLGAPWVIRYFFGQTNSGSTRADDIGFATSLLRMFAPQVALYGGVTLSTALLQTRHRFGTSMFAPIVNNLIVIVVFVWAARLIHQITPAGQTPAIGLIRQRADVLRILGWGTTAGIFAMLVVTLPALRSARLGLHWVWDPGHRAIRELLRLTGWTIGYVVANQVALSFVLRTAKRGPNGDVTSYTLATSTFFLLPHGVVAVSLISALGPSLSRAFIDRSRARFRRLLSQGLRSLLVIMVPAAAGMVVIARELTEVVLFTSDSRRTAGIGDVLRYLAVGLPAFSCYLMLMGGFKALRDTRATFEINVIENAINIIAGAVLYSWLGIRGLAAGFSMAYIAAAVIAFVVMSRRTAGLEERRVVLTMAKTTAASGAMATVVGLLMMLAERRVIPPVGQAGRWVALTAVTAVLVLLGVTVYVIVARLLALEDITTITATIRHRLRR
jgi:putative peptidoglycan lipid II flippase